MGSSETPCVLCGGHASDTLITLKESLFRRDTFRVVVCRTCGLARTEPRPSKEDISSYYPLHYGPYSFSRPKPLFPSGASGTEGLKEKIKKALLRARGNLPRPDGKRPPGILAALTAPLIYHLAWLFPPWKEGGKVLDVGCSTGEYLYRLRELGWEAYGVEPNERAAAWAAGELGLKVKSGELSGAHFPDSFFDALTFFHSLEHVLDPLAELREAGRVLRPGGCLIVEVPLLLKTESLLLGDNWSAWEVPRHLHHFTPATITALLEAAGFREIRLRHLPYLNIQAASLGSAVAARFPFLKSTAEAFFDTGRNRALNLLLTPLAWLLAAAGRTGRLLIYAKK